MCDCKEKILWFELESSNLETNVNEKYLKLIFADGVINSNYTCKYYSQYGSLLNTMETLETDYNKVLKRHNNSTSVVLSENFEHDSVLVVTTGNGTKFRESGKYTGVHSYAKDDEGTIYYKCVYIFDDKVISLVYKQLRNDECTCHFEK